MRTTHLLCSLLGLVLLAGSFPSTAAAQATKVWVSCRAGNAQCTKNFGPLEQAWMDAGATEVTIDTEIGQEVADGDYKLLVIYMPNEAIGSGDLMLTIPGFLSTGGRLVLVGEGDGNDPITEQANGHLQEVLDTVGNSEIQFASMNLGSGCDNSTTDIVSDPLTGGVSTWHYAAASNLAGGDPLIRFTPSGGGAPLVVAAATRLSSGEIVVFGDSDGFSSSCADQFPGQYEHIAVDHKPMWMNLFDASGSVVDNDGDGFNSDVDCNDDDPFVNPDADEDCDNGVDDDCDDLIDQDDPDCGGTSDDDDTSSDDDDTSSDDDDDTGGSGDDDDSSALGVNTYGGGEWQTGCCASSDMASLGAPQARGRLIGLLGLVALAGLRRRGRRRD